LLFFFFCLWLHLLERLFSQLYCLCSFVKDQFAYLCASTSGLSIPFHGLNCLFSCQYYTDLKRLLLKLMGSRIPLSGFNIYFLQNNCTLVEHFSNDEISSNVLEDLNSDSRKEFTEKNTFLVTFLFFLIYFCIRFKSLISTGMNVKYIIRVL
jgi:hypothetical protein